MRADTLSLMAWQVGMYSFMPFAHFWIFDHLFDRELPANSVEFWIWRVTYDGGTDAAVTETGASMPPQN